MKKITIKIIKDSGAIEPKYMTENAAGADLYAVLDGNIAIDPMERVIIPTGIRMEIPSGYEVQLRPRSGLAFKKGLTLLNTPGTIDSDYRGEVKVIAINLGHDTITIANGDRIAQMVVNEITQANFTDVDSLEDSKRGEGGIGHTGV